MPPLGPGVGTSLPALLLLAGVADAATIHVSPGDGDTAYELIEGAGAGDEVVIAPGTYHFRVYLDRGGTEREPIVIRAEDPDDRPVWDLDGTPVIDAPGSYTGGDRGRGCWQVAASHYRISGIVFTNCRGADPGSSAGIRFYNDATDLLIRDCTFRENDNGLTGGSEGSEATVEFCEFDRNGNVDASPPTHNIYVYGGTFTLRYSYVHDSTQGTNLHCRAHDGTIEYNWFARAAGFEAQFDASDFPPAGHYTQRTLFRGNVVVQADEPGNGYKVLTLYNDLGNDADWELRAIGNTFVGNGGTSAFVQMANDDGTPMSVELVNNIIAGTTVLTVAGDDSQATTTGSGNWVQTGTPTDGLQDSVVGNEPGFLGDADFRLAAGSACLGAADATVTDAPDREYYRDEALGLMYRTRATAGDIGAFEHTTEGPGVGPYGEAPAGGDTDASPSGSGADAGPEGNDAGVGGGDGGGTREDPGGCGCRIGPRAMPASPWAIGVALGLFAALAGFSGRRRPPRR